MKYGYTATLALAVLAMATASMAQETAAPSAPETGSGPYPAVYEENPGLPDHVVYHPRELAAAGPAKLPLYVFGNGGCSDDGTSSRNHLLEIASHGYLVIAPGHIPALHPAKTETAKPAAGLSVQTLPSLLSDAIDWALKENDRAQSPYFHRIDAQAIAVSGWSCGGLQAIIVAPDPRIKTLVVMNSGVFNGNANPIPGMIVSKDMLPKIHGSALYVLGGPTDIAYANGTDDYSRLSVPAALVNIPVGHGGTYMQPHGGVAAEVVVNWLDWKLKGDQSKAVLFTGADCAYCRDPRLTLETKNLD